MARNVLRTLTNVNATAYTKWLDGVMCMKIGSVVRVYGGWYGFDVPPSQNTILQLNETTGALVNTGLHIPRKVHTAGFGVRSDGKGLIIGGDVDSNSTDQQEVTLIDTDGTTCSHLSSQSFMLNRMLYGCVVDGMNVYLMGGQKISDPTQGFSDVWKSTDGGITFSQIATGKTFLNANLAGAVCKYGDFIYAVMQPSRYDNVDANRTYSLNVYRTPDGITWTQVNDFEALRAFQYINLIEWDGLLWMVNGSQSTGGGSAANTRTIWNYNGDDWARIQAIPTADTHATGVCVADDNRLWIILGNTSTNTDVIELTDIDSA